MILSPNRLQANLESFAMVVTDSAKKKVKSVKKPIYGSKLSQSHIYEHLVPEDTMHCSD